MAIIYFDGEKVRVEEDAATLEAKIRKAQDDRTLFVHLTLEGNTGSTWVNVGRILRFTE